MYECGYDTRGNIVGYYLQNQTTRETINSGEFTYNIYDVVLVPFGLITSLYVLIPLALYE